MTCLTVSLMLSLSAPLLTMQVAMPAEDEAVYDLSVVTNEEIARGGVETALEASPRRELHGWWERFTYPFTHPQIGYFYLKASIAIFPFVFAAAALASYLNVRRKANA